MIRRKRVYEAPAPSDGQRFLVDRLWPRGMCKQKAHLAEWLKVIAPSTALRQAYHRGDLTFEALTECYEAELMAQPKAVACLADLAQRSATQPITLVYAARHTAHNHVQILMNLLQHQFGAVCASETAE